jgi:endonuclease YncB( thermonuclease family)
MKPVTRTGPRRGGFVAAALPCSLMLVAAAASSAVAAGCALESQGEGRVAAVIDSRTFRLQDGREVRLAGIEPVVAEKANRTSALAAIVAGREVKLHGEDDTPDRYGRQPAFLFLDGSETMVQGLLLAQGEALVSATVTNKDCATVLFAAETPARDAKRGTWAIWPP